MCHSTGKGTFKAFLPLLRSRSLRTPLLRTPLLRTPLLHTPLLRTRSFIYLAKSVEDLRSSNLLDLIEIVRTETSFFTIIMCIIL